MTEKIQAEKLEFIRKFIRENKSSLSTLFFIEELNTENEEDIKLYTETIENLHKTFPNNELVNELFGKINKVEIGEGSIAPEITLPNEAGEMVSLSSLKGKVVLIDFWASWCAPCRAEMPNLTTAYQSYKSKGFEIYSISLDRTREPWIEAKNADKMTWICVHDINGSYGGVYGVEAIPYTVLIDKDGKIIATNLRGTELEEKLAELFK